MQCDQCDGTSDCAKCDGTGELCDSCGESPDGCACSGQMKYTGRFPLHWLLDDEQVGSAGDGHGTALIEWPGGRLFVHPDQTMVRGADGRLTIFQGGVIQGPKRLEA